MVEVEVVVVETRLMLAYRHLHGIQIHGRPTPALLASAEATHIPDQRHLLMVGAERLLAMAIARLLTTPLPTIDLMAGAVAAEEAMQKTSLKHHLPRTTRRHLALVPLLLEVLMCKTRRHLACTGILLARVPAMAEHMQRRVACRKRRLPSRRPL